MQQRSGPLIWICWETALSIVTVNSWEESDGRSIVGFSCVNE